MLTSTIDNLCKEEQHSQGTIARAFKTSFDNKNGAEIEYPTVNQVRGLLNNSQTPINRESIIFMQ